MVISDHARFHIHYVIDYCSKKYEIESIARPVFKMENDNSVFVENIDWYNDVIGQINLEDEEIWEVTRNLANEIGENDNIYSKDAIQTVAESIIGDEFDGETIDDQHDQCYYYILIIDMILKMSNWEGEFKYNRQVVNELIDDQLGYLHDSPEEQRILCPILDFKCEDEFDIPVENFDFVNQTSRFELLECKVRPVKQKDRSSIYTFEGGINLRGVDHSPWSYLLDIKTRSVSGTIYYRQFIKSMAILFRLLKPRQPAPVMGPTYTIEPGPLERRENLHSISGSSPPEFGTRTTYTGRAIGQASSDEYEFYQEDKEDFIEMWTQYCNLTNVDRNTPFSNSLHRYDSMYFNIFPEDRVVDCAIGIEGTLLKDLGTQSSYTFRMILRAGMLLGNHMPKTREEIHELLKNLYYVRSQIVHKDNTVEEAITDKTFKGSADESSPEEFVKDLREVFAELLIMYMNAYENRGKSITEVNQNIDKTALSSSWSFNT